MYCLQFLLDIGVIPGNEKKRKGGDMEGKMATEGMIMIQSG
jgi:hypothetical protein